MGLIKPGLGRRPPDPGEPTPEANEFSACVPPVTAPRRHQRSPLAARTAALIQRLRATSAAAQQSPSPDARSAPFPASDAWPSDLNRVQLTGRLAREPLLHDVGDHHVAELQLVSERRWRTRPGSVVRAHSWHRLTAWEELADLCGRLLHAGDRVYVEGQLRPIVGQIAGAPTTTYELVLERVILLSRATPRGQEGAPPANPALTWPEQPW